jgi:hypothetical protein
MVLGVIILFVISVRSARFVFGAHWLLGWDILLSLGVLIAFVGLTLCQWGSLQSSYGGGDRRRPGGSGSSGSARPIPRVPGLQENGLAETNNNSSRQIKLSICSRKVRLRIPLVVLHFYLIKPPYDIPDELLNIVPHFMIFSKSQNKI